MEERAISQASVAGLSELETSKVLRNTYLLLGMTLAFSAITGGIAVAMGAQPVAGFWGWAIAMALIFGVHFTANSALGLVMVFAFTGYMGYYVGPFIEMVMGVPGGASAVTSAFGLTAFAFVGLSAFALITRKDFGFLTGFLTVGAWVLLGSIILGFIFDLGAFRLMISGAFVVFASALILWQTSAIIHGGETNYIRATVTLFVSIYNLFMSLLHLFMAFGGDD